MCDSHVASVATLLQEVLDQQSQLRAQHKEKEEQAKQLAELKDAQRQNMQEQEAERLRVEEEQRIAEEEHRRAEEAREVERIQQAEERKLEEQRQQMEEEAKKAQAVQEERERAEAARREEEEMARAAKAKERAEMDSAQKKADEFLTAKGFKSFSEPRKKFMSSCYALHKAVEENDADAVSALLHCGADPGKKNSAGKTPRELAEKLHSKKGTYGLVVKALAPESA